MTKTRWNKNKTVRVRRSNSKEWQEWLHSWLTGWHKVSHDTDVKKEWLNIWLNWIRNWKVKFLRWINFTSNSTSGESDS